MKEGWWGFLRRDHYRTGSGSMRCFALRLRASACACACAWALFSTEPRRKWLTRLSCQAAELCCGAVRCGAVQCSGPDLDSGQSPL